MLEGLALSSGWRALDLGAGQGDGSHHLRVIGAQTVYADLSREMLQMGLQRGIMERGRALLCDLRSPSLPFQNCSFDLITMRYVIHDIENKRVLPHGGDEILTGELLHRYTEC